MIASIKRLAHRYGNGVHSPFAYRFITDVVRPPKGAEYYATPRLRGMLKDMPGKRRREYLLLFRLVARLNPPVIYIDSPDAERLFDVIQLASGNARCRRGAPDKVSAGELVITDAVDYVPGNGTLDEAGNILVLRNSGAGIVAEVIEEINGGWSFEDKEIAIFVANSSDILSRVKVKIL